MIHGEILFCWRDEAKRREFNRCMQRSLHKMIIHDLTLINMKTLLTLFFALWIGLSCFGQEVEFCGSLNTSSEQRFQNAYGVGLQYQQDLNQKFQVGLGIHYNFNDAVFDHIPYLDASPDLIATENIHSTAKRISIRLNIQGLLKNNKNVSLSLGPEISYNFLWGEDQINERMGDNSPGYETLTSNQYNFSQTNDLKKEIGIGLISKLEVKDFIAKPLALCFTIRPELLLGKTELLIGGEQPVFSGVLGFTEFQIGLIYRFKK
jgi:hypothetical protein